MYTTSILILLASAGLIDGRSIFEARHADKRHLHHLTHKRSVHEDIVQARELANLVQGRAAGDASATTLAANAIQTGSFVDGTQEIGANVAQQAPSLTSQNNFINFCAGKVLTNGLQITTGSCNGITMGDLPAKNLMVSSIITFPLHGSATIQSDTTFTITVQMSNLVAGSFTNADATYYAAPQALSGGKVVGHTHVTVQDLGATLNPTTALDPTQFAFFKGINDAGNGQGLLSAVVTGGLPAGNYRVCTLASSSNHQPVIMPVAQRGTVDDCTKFTVIGNGKVENIAANGGSKGIAAAALAASAVANGAGNPDPAKTGNAAASASASASSLSDSSSSVAAATGKGGKGGKDTKTSSSGSLSVAAATTKAGGKGGKDTKTTLSASESKATTKAGGQGGKGTNTTLSASENKATTKAGGKGGKDTKTTLSASESKATNKASAKGGKGNAVASSSFFFANTTVAATTKAVQATSIVSLAAAATSAKSGNAGKGGKGRKVTHVFVKKIVIIETFFEFNLALGGLCPSIAKKNNKFAILEELFDDLNSAASAACGKQYTSCVGFSGNGFSIEECITQKSSCRKAAVTAKAASTAAQLTATVTVPASASVAGSVVSEATFTTTVEATSTVAAAVAPVVTKAAAVDVLSPSESLCTIVTSTVFVDAPAATIASSVASSVIAAAPSSTASAASTVSTSGALGGIAAPAITDSGDATRPFLVNGNTFVDKPAAVQRSCDIQFNLCANAVNGGKATGFGLAECQRQEDDCAKAA